MLYYPLPSVISLKEYGNLMNVLICDDIKSEAHKLANMMTGRGFDINIKVFYNAADSLEYISSGAKVDVCFLDIVMPGTSGIELAFSLREYGYTGFIVFLSASKDYGPESYQVKAFNYLVKPISISDIRVIFEELTDALSMADTAGILIKAHESTRNLPFRSISFIEVENNYVFFRLTDNSILKVRTPLTEIAEALQEDSRFIRCHRSFIVNISEVKSMKNNDFTMKSGAVVPISRNNTEAKKMYLKSIKGQGGG